MDTAATLGPLRFGGSHDGRAADPALPAHPPLLPRDRHCACTSPPTPSRPRLTRYIASSTSPRARRPSPARARSDCWTPRLGWAGLGRSSSWAPARVGLGWAGHVIQRASRWAGPDVTRLGAWPGSAPRLLCLHLTVCVAIDSLRTMAQPLSVLWGIRNLTSALLHRRVNVQLLGIVHARQAQGWRAIRADVRYCSVQRTEEAESRWKPQPPATGIG